MKNRWKGGEDMHHKKHKRHYFDYSLLFIIIFLLCFGMVMLYSTSAYNAQMKFGDSLYYLKNQLFATAIGAVVMVAFIYWGYRFSKPLSIIMYIVSLLMILLVLTPLGIESHGARRWVNLGLISFQPAEFAKLSTIILTSALAAKYARVLHVRGNIFRLMMIPVIPAGMVAVITSNLSSAIIIAMIGFVILFIASPNWKFFFKLAAGAAVALVLFLMFGSGFRAERFVVWQNPEQYLSGTGYQIMQGLYAIGSGGLFGKGLGQSVQKLGFIPEAQNDYIFTIICEELGLFGGIAVILMFLFMLWRFLIIANNAPDLYSSLLVIGVMAHIAIQVILNIAVVTNTIPNTGITLPFISYGGTSVMFLMAEMGLVLSLPLKT